MTNEVEVFEEELVPVLEELDGYQVIGLVEASREMRMLVSRRLDRVLNEEEFCRMWIPFDMASSGVNLDLIFPTHLLVPEDVETDGVDTDELYSHAEATFDLVTKHIEVKNDALEDELRAFGDRWEDATVMEELDLFIKRPLDISETTFTVCHGIECRDADGDLSGEGLAELKDVVQDSGEAVSDQLFSMDRPKEVLNLVLTALSEKEGTDIYGRVEEMETVERFIDVLTGLGLHCGVKVTEFDNYPPFVRLFATRDPGYSCAEYRQFFCHRDRGIHELTGEFYGYPEEEVEAWIAWQEGEGSEKVDVAAKLASEYDIPTETRRRMMAFINYMVRDREESVQNAADVADRRYEALEEAKEEYGVDFLEYLEAF